MKKIFAYHALMRILSILAPLALIIVRFALARSGRHNPGFCLDLLYESLVLSNVVLGMYPDDMQDSRFSFIFASVTVVLSCIAGVFGKSSFVAVCSLAAYLMVMALGPFSKLKICFRDDSVWAIFANYASYFYICLFLMISELFLLTSLNILRIALVVLLSALLVVRYVSAYTGWTFLVSRSRENRIKKSINGFLRGIPAEDMPDEKKLLMIYERAVKYFEDEKAFLEPDYEMRDLAAAIFSNKTYVSRAINYYSGKNFRQFMNYFRVKYSIELMKENPELTVVELALRSGFHSTVSYNLSFKLVMNDTPSSYCKEFVIPERLSR